MVTPSVTSRPIPVPPILGAMTDEFESILKKKLEAASVAEAEAAKKEQERQEHEAKLNGRLEPALEVIASELEPVAAMLVRNGYKSATVENPAYGNRWQGRELRVKLNDDPRAPGLRYYVNNGRVFAVTKVT